MKSKDRVTGYICSNAEEGMVEQLLVSEVDYLSFQAEL